MEESQQTNFSIKLDGELDGVDIQTFVDLLSNLSVAIHELNDELKTDRSLKINIKEIRKGSYDIFLVIKEAFLDSISQYTTKDILWYGGTLIAFLANLLLIRKHLKGEKPINIEEDKQVTTIENKNGTTINVDNRVYNVFKNNQIIDSSIGKSFDAIEEDKSINQFEMLDNRNKLMFKAERDEFKGLSLPSPFPEEDTRVITEESVLHVFKVVFEKGYKWQFIYRGTKISADIEDQRFYERIDKGIKFSKGDVLIADLEITKVFDKTLQTYINKAYKIKKILKHLPRSLQPELFE